VCGFPPGEPGYLRPGGCAGQDALIPCPECSGVKLTQRRQLLFSHQLEGVLRDKTFDNYARTDGNAAALQAAIAFAAKPAGMLAFWGAYGDGKTHLLAAIANEVGGPAKYYTFPDLASQYRASIGNDVEGFYRIVSRVPVLLVDEIDKVSLTNRDGSFTWTREQSYRIFDYRYRNRDRLGTVFAFNMQPDKADDVFGYLFSRMDSDDVDNCRLIHLTDGDNRQKQGLLRKLAGLQCK